MKATLTKQEWENWKEQEFLVIKQILKTKEIILDENQNHISGERFLMSGKKLVLQGLHSPTAKKVIVKYSSDPESTEEIVDERRRKKNLEEIHFGYKSIYFPVEIFYEETKIYTILITEYIEQPEVIIKLPIQEQFFLSLKALEAFEGVHSVVTSHSKALSQLQEPFSAKKYLSEFMKMFQETQVNIPDLIETLSALQSAKKFLEENKPLIDKYCDFLTHNDFVPHNMRIMNNDIVVLDHSSLIVGNKYESWARYLNFMVLYSPELENLLSSHVKKNRNDDEYLMLRVMRAYKISFLINFYSKAINKTEGGLHIITSNRLTMWTKNLLSILEDTKIPEQLTLEHHKILNEHRSVEEKKRHKEISG